MNEMARQARRNMVGYEEEKDEDPFKRRIKRMVAKGKRDGKKNKESDTNS